MIEWSCILYLVVFETFDMLELTEKHHIHDEAEVGGQYPIILDMAGKIREKQHASASHIWMFQAVQRLSKLSLSSVPSVLENKIHSQCSLTTELYSMIFFRPQPTFCSVMSNLVKNWYMNYLLPGLMLTKSRQTVCSNKSFLLRKRLICVHSILYSRNRTIILSHWPAC